MTFDEFLKDRAARTEAWLATVVPAEIDPPGVLHKAIRYSLLDGGKRLRPVLCIATAEMFDCPEIEVMPVACALEMIHTYSLIHDDLPSMDNDDLRRGRPTSHRMFGEAVAILAGDALVTRAFGILAEGISDPSIAARRLRIVELLARAAGAGDGMVGGQVLDLEAEGCAVDGARLDALHAAKTGALLTASVVAGAIAGGAGERELGNLERYGRGLGLAFQIADDVLDVTSTTEQLGKTAGKDAAVSKATYPGLFGIEASIARARQVVEAATAELEPFGPRADRLREIACFAIERQK